MSKLIVLLGSASIAVAVFLWLPRTRTQTAPAAFQFVPDLKNDKTITVRGWREEELSTMVKDFAQMYQLSSEPKISRTDLGSEVLRLSFPDDLEPDKFSFLVNYLRYPKGFDLNGRIIGVLGRTTLSSQYNVPDPTLVGKKAEFYVPSNDDQFDRVYVRAELGQTYENSFAASKWRLVGDDRFPETARGL